MWITQGGLKWVGVWVDVVLFGSSVGSFYDYSKPSV